MIKTDGLIESLKTPCRRCGQRNGTKLVIIHFKHYELVETIWFCESCFN